LIRLDGKQTLDLRRVMLERATVTGTDLDHPPAQSGKHLATQVACDEIRLAQLPLLEVAREPRLLRAVERRLGAQRSISSTR
jgi:hypothetical protein